MRRISVESVSVVEHLFVKSLDVLLIDYSYKITVLETC